MGISISANSAAERAALAQAAPLEVLTLRLGAEAYGIDIMVVQEIRSFETPTRIAQAPAHVLGVCNLRAVNDIGANFNSIRRLESQQSTEQAGGVSQLGEAASQMDQTTQQNAALVEESAAAAESLRNQALQLSRAVSVFKLADAPASAPAVEPVAAPMPAAKPPVWRGPARAAPLRRLRAAAQEREAF